MQTRHSKLVIFAFLIMALAMSAPPVIDVSTSTNSYCNSDGTPSWAFEELTSTTTPKILEFDDVSAYRDLVTSESVPLLVKRAVGVEPFKFVRIDKKTLEPVEKACLGTKISDGLTFVSIINQFLFFKKSGEYFFCHYDQKDTATAFSLIKINIPATSIIPETITIFSPTSAGQKTENQFIIYIFWGSQYTRALMMYTLDYQSTRTANSHTLSEEIAGGKITGSPSYIAGNGYIIYNPDQNRFFVYNVGSWSEFKFGNMVINYPMSSQFTKIYKLHSNCAIVSFLPTSSSGELYLFDRVALNVITWTSASATPYKDYSDGVSNFLRYGSDKVLWFTLTPEASNLQAQIPTTELTVAGQEIQSISMSGNVATIFYPSKIRYLRQTKNGVQQLFEKSITSSDMDLTKSVVEYKIKFSCLCSSVKTYICFSTTLNCLIVKKISDRCSEEGIFTEPTYP